MPEAPKRFKKRDDKFGAGRRRRVCSFCSDKQGYIDYKEINRLRRYLGTCAQHQREVTAALKRARQMALLPYAPQHQG